MSLDQACRKWCRIGTIWIALVRFVLSVGQEPRSRVHLAIAGSGFCDVEIARFLSLASLCGGDDPLEGLAPNGSPLSSLVPSRALNACERMYGQLRDCTVSIGGCLHLL